MDSPTPIPDGNFSISGMFKRIRQSEEKKKDTQSPQSPTDRMRALKVDHPPMERSISPRFISNTISKLQQHGVVITPRTLTRACIDGKEAVIKRTAQLNLPAAISPRELISPHQMSIPAFISPSDMHLFLPEKNAEPIRGSLKDKYNTVEINLRSDSTNPEIELRAYLETLVENVSEDEKRVQKVKKIVDREVKFNQLVSGCPYIVTFKRYQEEKIICSIKDGKNVEYPAASHEKGVEVLRERYVLPLYDQDLYLLIANKIPLTQRQILRVMYDIVQGVEYLHSKEIIHRDLKLENILVSHASFIDKVKGGVDENKIMTGIIDMGLACMQSEEEKIIGKMIGTLAYWDWHMMAHFFSSGSREHKNLFYGPLEEHRKHLPKVDIYSLAILFFYLIKSQKSMSVFDHIDLKWIEHQDNIKNCFDILQDFHKIDGEIEKTKLAMKEKEKKKKDKTHSISKDDNQIELAQRLSESTQRLSHLLQRVTELAQKDSRRDKERKKHDKAQQITKENLSAFVQKEITKENELYLKEQEKWNNKTPPSKNNFYEFLIWMMLQKDLKKRLSITELKAMLQQELKKKRISFDGPLLEYPPRLLI